MAMCHSPDELGYPRFFCLRICYRLYVYAAMALQATSPTEMRAKAKDASVAIVTSG